MPELAQEWEAADADYMRALALGCREDLEQWASLNAVTRGAWKEDFNAILERLAPEGIER